MCQGTYGGVTCAARQLHCHQTMHWLQVLISRESESDALSRESESWYKMTMFRKNLPEAAQFLDQFVLQARQSQMVRQSYVT